MSLLTILRLPLFLRLQRSWKTCKSQNIKLSRETKRFVMNNLISTAIKKQMMPSLIT